MRKLVGGGLASAVAVGVSMVLAAPGGAGVEPLQASVDPGAVEPGEPTVVESEDPCDGALSIVVFDPDGGTDAFDWETDGNGHWGLAYYVGDGDPLGEYTVAATCGSADGTLKVAYEALTPL